MKSSNSKISYDLKPAHTPDQAEKLASMLITHARSFTPSPNWISTVFSEFDRKGHEILDLSSIKLAFANAVIMSNVYLLRRMLAFKIGTTVGEFIALMIDASGQLPDDLVRERIEAAGILWFERGEKIYLSDRLTENQLSNILLES